MSKKTRTRACPAAGRDISAAECGAGRHTTYACPDQCPFNPFSAANYGEFGRIEFATQQKLFGWMVANVPDREQFDGELANVLGDGPNQAYFHWLVRRSVFQNGPDGESCIGRWAKAGFPDLTGDESTYARGMGRTRPALIEVHRLLDDRCTEVVDLADPDRQPILVVDRTFARQAGRFQVFTVYLIPLPNYSRIFGAGTLIPDLDPLEPEEVIREIVAHLGGRADEAGVRDFLKQDFKRFEQAVLAVASARAELMFEAMDAQFGKRNYKLVLPYGQCRARLDASPDVSPDPLPDEEREEGFVEGRVWFARPGDRETELIGQHATLGRVLLSPGRWRLQAMGKDQLGRLRQRFEALMAGAVRFTSQFRTDLTASVLEDRVPHDPALVPPALLRNIPALVLATSRVPVSDDPGAEQDVVAEFHRQQDREFLDSPVPGLGDKTPRQAASDPVCRPKLVRMMKSRIRSTDERNLETGGTEDINWMVRELGLDEILFDPPPPRPRLSRDQD